MSFIRILDGSEAPATISWDTIWTTDLASGALGAGDWALAGEDEERNQGGFRAVAALETAVILCLFTDRRRPDYAAAPDGSEDRRGWAGDTFDLDREAGERPLGSLLWTLERSPLDNDTARLAEAYATEALQTLVDQGVATEIAATAECVGMQGRLDLHVVVRGGGNAVERSFQRVQGEWVI